MHYLTAYEEAFRNLAIRMLFPEFETPAKAIDRWADLVKQMKNGYPDIQPELENDLDTIREPIQTFLADPELGQFREHEEFTNGIRNLDAEFLEISIAHPSWQKENDFRWWKNRILKYGSETYATFMNTHLDKRFHILTRTI